MRFGLQWRGATRYIAIAVALLGYAYLIDHMVKLTLQQQQELSNAGDGQQELLPVAGQSTR